MHMNIRKVELVLAIDSSASMAPCFQGLIDHLDKLVNPLQADHFDLRLGLMALSASKNEGQCLYPMESLAGPNMDTLDALYRQRKTSELFTGDRRRLISTLKSVRLQGDEDLLMLLDCAADFPFSPSAQTRRVIALFSDEPIEGGLLDGSGLRRIPDLCNKLMMRRIKLFAALPESEAAHQLAATDQSELECVEGGEGLAGVDFVKLLRAMAKSISVNSLQSGPLEDRYTPGLFGQPGFREGHGEIVGR